VAFTPSHCARKKKFCRAFQTTENLVQAKHTIFYKQGSSILSGAPNNFIFDILTSSETQRQNGQKFNFSLKRKVEKEMGAVHI
jgi:hypothetical protein